MIVIVFNYKENHPSENLLLATGSPIPATGDIIEKDSEKLPVNIPNPLLFKVKEVRYSLSSYGTVTGITVITNEL